MNEVNPLIILLATSALKGVNNVPAVQENLRDVGRSLAKQIPGDSIEPELNKAFDLIQEGLIE